jgi:hypothetical protein
VHINLLRARLAREINPDASPFTNTVPSSSSSSSSISSNQIADALGSSLQMVTALQGENNDESPLNTPPKSLVTYPLSPQSPYSPVFDESGGRYVPSVWEACVNIQGWTRAYFARRIVSLMLLDRIVKVYRKDIGMDFYYNRITGNSSWEPPTMLFKKHRELLTYLEEDEDAGRKGVWVCKRACGRRRPVEAALNKMTNKKERVRLAGE